MPTESFFPVTQLISVYSSFPQRLQTVAQSRIFKSKESDLWLNLQYFRAEFESSECTDFT